MIKRYYLLKESPGYKEGAIFEKILVTGYYKCISIGKIKFIHENVECLLIPEEVENNPEWFEPSYASNTSKKIEFLEIGSDCYTHGFTGKLKCKVPVYIRAFSKIAFKMNEIIQDINKLND